MEDETSLSEECINIYLKNIQLSISLLFEFGIASEYELNYFMAGATMTLFRSQRLSY